MTSTDRIVRPAGLLNFRDVGGLAAGPGRRVRYGVLYRSDTPQFLDAGDVDVLVHDLGLRTEIDLRRTEEADREGRGPLAATDVVHARCPVVSRRAQAAQLTDLPTAAGAVSVPEHYLGYLDVSGAAVAGAVAALARPQALPALVHCAAGKDRTGVVVAFALSVAGVPDDDVAAEYAIGPERVARTVDRLRTLPGYAAMIDNMPPEAHLTPARYMVEFLAAVRARYGSPRAWLATAGGVGQDVLDRLAELLTEPTP